MTRKRVIGFRLLANGLLLTTVATAGTHDWPQFRGPNGTGVAEGRCPPTAWNIEQGVNIKWKTPIPGLGHSSPIVWGERVFVTSAVPEGDKEPFLRPGLYGESPDNPENYVHHFNVYCLDKSSGQIAWVKTAYSGIPKIQRHVKSSHATCTPATDGKHLVAFFGSEGLYCYDLDGKLLWSKDFGVLDSGAFDAPQIRWGFGSSPILYENKIIVQCDVNNQSFIAAFDADTGNELWRTLREEVATWSTPSVYRDDTTVQLVCNGWKHIGGYDLKTGAELWRMHGGGDIPVPTPVIAHGMAFITNGHGGLMPIYAIKLPARGDISLAEDQTTNEHIAWAELRRGAYIPTPLVYGDYLYVCNDRGILTCYKAATGEQAYRTRAGGGRGAYSASAVAVDGTLFFTSEEGEIHVVKAGPEYELIATNAMNGVCMATPAIADGALFVRTSRELYCIVDNGATKPAATPAAPPTGQ